jgi:hypothetical protein
MNRPLIFLRGGIVALAFTLASGAAAQSSPADPDADLRLQVQSLEKRTLGGGAITNPGRYLVLLPPINGATASTGSPYFTQNPGQKFDAWDCSITFDYMPNDWATWRMEGNHRAANTPYFAGPGGITPLGGNTGTPGTLVSGFTPDLRRNENRITLALLVKI